MSNTEKIKYFTCFRQIQQFYLQKVPTVEITIFCNKICISGLYIGLTFRYLFVHANCQGFNAGLLLEFQSYVHENEKALNWRILL